ncbi:hypothetical protein DsansV1_C04g0039981 [Dioscorea sansibarensis]
MFLVRKHKASKETIPISPCSTQGNILLTEKLHWTVYSLMPHSSFL